MKKGPFWLLLLIVFLIIGCQPEAHMDNSLIVANDENIKDYLVKNIGISSFGGVEFCSYELLNAEQGESGKVYLWVLCQEFYLEEEVIYPGSGISLPVVLLFQDNDEIFEIIDHITPRDGTHFGDDVRDAFPRKTWSQIMPQGNVETKQYNQRANELEKEAELQANEFFMTNKEDRDDGE